MRYIIIFILVVGVMSIISCQHKPQFITTSVNISGYGGFPDSIGKILVAKCATDGCHNAQSYSNAAGLRLDTWESLFDGSNSGAVIVPFSDLNSSLLQYINPADSLGIKAQPQMPLNATALTKQEYLTVKNWIVNGAPDRNGNIPFALDADSRQKIYVANQGCDLLAVIDAQKKVIMRYVKVGIRDNVSEVPHYVKASADGYIYVSFLTGTVLQKIDTRKDSVVGSVEIGSGSWNAFQISDDGKKILLGDYNAGYVISIVTENMSIETRFSGLNMVYPHGILGNSSFDSFYITSQLGNFVYRFSTNPFLLQQISIDNYPPTPSPPIKRNPHEIISTPDRTKCFLTCDASNEIRVLDIKTGALIDSINVGIFPQTMALSHKKPYLFITCTEDTSAMPGFKGSVYVIDYNTNKIVKRIDGPFYQPHGIVIDDRNGYIYIANRNVESNGPAPHHASYCGKRNGYYVVYSINTLERLPLRYEMSVDPYSADIRFKQ